VMIIPPVHARRAFLCPKETAPSAYRELRPPTQWVGFSPGWGQGRLNRKQGFDFWRPQRFQAWCPNSEVASVLISTAPNFGPLCREPNGNLSRARPEFERGIIRECVNAGLARARQNGTKLGRRRVKPSVEATIRELWAKGDGILKIARTLGAAPALSKGRLGGRLTVETVTFDCRRAVQIPSMRQTLWRQLPRRSTAWIS
jgi:hypothetical protein